MKRKIGEQGKYRDNLKYIEKKLRNKESVWEKKTEKQLRDRKMENTEKKIWK